VEGGREEVLVAGNGLQEGLESGGVGQQERGRGLLRLCAISEVSETEAKIETEELGSRQTKQFLYESA
jgi:hypothetical protein